MTAPECGLTARLYHCTSRSNAKLIKKNGFRCGSVGTAGGGIYFATSISDASLKSAKNGVVLECDVDLGRVMKLAIGNPTFTLKKIRELGYDTIMTEFWGGRGAMGWAEIPLVVAFGKEYCVYEPFRINIVGEHKDLPQNKITKFLKPLVFGVGYKLYKLHVNFRQLQNVRQTIWTPEMEYSL